MLHAAIAATISAVAGAVLTGLFRAYAVRRGISDVPNERSSHEVPTPRGGGVSMVLLAVTAAVGLAVVGGGRWPLALAAGGALVAGVGWLDDVGGVRAGARFAVHAAAAGVVIALVGDQIRLDLAPGVVLAGAAAWALVVPFVVWSINAFNFMDGIDGIAGGQCATVCAAAAGLAFGFGEASGLVLILAVLAGSAIGFLVHNWHPARVFMGDVASGFLGFALAVATLWGAANGALPLLAFLVLMGAFHVDATYTLLRRVAAGQRVYQAHRDHAYQHAVQRGRSHATVAGAYLSVNLLWLAPAAAIICWRPAWGLPCAAIALAPLLLAAIALRAGVKPEQA